MHFNKFNFIRGLVIAAITVLIFFLIYSLVLDFRVFRKSGYLRPTHFPRQLFSGRFPVGTTTIGIAPWMTFSYINKIYGIPNDYFKNALFINDRRYPQLTIHQFSVEEKFSTLFVLKRIQTLIGNFGSATSTTSTSSVSP